MDDLNLLRRHGQHLEMAMADGGPVMDKQALIDAVNEIFVDSFEIPPEKIKPEAEIFADIGLDSLDVVDLVVAIQKRFSVQVRDDERVRSIRTMQNLYDYLASIQEEQAAKKS